MEEKKSRHLGDLIRLLREEAGLSIRELAHRVNFLSATTITTIERNGLGKSLYNLAALRACPALDGLVERACGEGLLTKERVDELLAYEANHTPYEIARAKLLELEQRRMRRAEPDRVSEARTDTRRGLARLCPEARAVILALRGGAFYASDQDRVFLIGPVGPGVDIASCPRTRLRPLNDLLTMRLVGFTKCPDLPEPYARVGLTKAGRRIK